MKISQIYALILQRAPDHPEDKLWLFDDYSGYIGPTASVLDGGLSVYGDEVHLPNVTVIGVPNDGPLIIDDLYAVFVNYVAVHAKKRKDRFLRLCLHTTGMVELWNYDEELVLSYPTHEVALAELRLRIEGDPA